MKTNLKKTPLSREQMKAIQGGRFMGCAAQGQSSLAYTDGCCTGLVACGGAFGVFCEPVSACN